MGPNDYCCHKCKFIWPKLPTERDPLLVRHILCEMRDVPGRYPDLENAMNRMGVGALRDLHRLLRELNGNTHRATSRARQGFIR